MDSEGEKPIELTPTHLDTMADWLENVMAPGAPRTLLPDGRVLTLVDAAVAVRMAAEAIRHRDAVWAAQRDALLGAESGVRVVGESSELWTVVVVGRLAGDARRREIYLSACVSAPSAEEATRVARREIWQSQPAPQRGKLSSWRPVLTLRGEARQVAAEKEVDSDY